MGKASTVLVGSKATALTPEGIYNVAQGGFVVVPDSARLELFAGKKSKGAVEVLPRPSISDAALREPVELLPDVQVRATLVVLLHKLLLAPPGKRGFLPVFIAEALNLGLVLEISASNDLAGVLGFIDCVYRVREASDVVSSLEETGEGASVTGQVMSASVLGELKKRLLESKAGDIGLTQEEMDSIKSNFAPAVGIAALAAYYLNSLTVVADAVAALSCEALRANTETFAPEFSDQDLVGKSESDVAADLSSLLFGSKLVKARKGGVDAVYIRNVPAAHGALRDAVKLLAPRLRVEINRVSSHLEKLNPISISLSDDGVRSAEGTSSSCLFTNNLLPVFVSLLPNISASLQRASKGLELVRYLALDSDTLKMDFTATKDFKLESTEVIVALKQSMRDAAGIAAVSGDENVLHLSREVLSAVEIWRQAICKECTLALALLAVREFLMVGPTPEQDIGDSSCKEKVVAESAADVNGKPKKPAQGKPSKVKKEFVLGKGTEIARDLLTGSLSCFSVLGQSLSVLDESLNRLLYPDVLELKAIVTAVKNVLMSNESRRVPKIAKGTRDFKPEQMAIREKAFGIIASVFKRHGAVALDTPVFELRETLMGKYGEDSKLIYDLADQGGEMCSLRYDLTVPFARYLAMNKVENLKRYHIARVYRRDNPAKGRFREFYQCDFDIAGQYAPMVPDFEVLKVLTELLNELDIGDYEVKLNHRKLLDGILDICGVPQSKFRTICSAIDKLDKVSWDKVKKEMVDEKGLPPDVADKIGEFVQKRGSPIVLLEELKQAGSKFLQHSGSEIALQELTVLFKYLKTSKCIDRIVFDLSLARGLDYYTGVIYEAVLTGSNEVGSIAAGGRYDNLVGMFSGKPVPAVGVSLGIERVFVIMEKQEEERKRAVRANQTDVLVVVLGKDEKWTEVAIEIVTELWDGRVKAEFACGRITQQVTKAAISGIPWVVVAGEDEIREGVLQLKNMSTTEQEKIQRSSLVTELQKRIGRTEELPTVVQ